MSWVVKQTLSKEPKPDRKEDSVTLKCDLIRLVFDVETIDEVNNFFTGTGHIKFTFTNQEDVNKFRIEKEINTLFRNSVETTIKELTVQNENSLLVKFSGRFVVVMDLHNFPYDQQIICLVLADRNTIHYDVEELQLTYSMRRSLMNYWHITKIGVYQDTLKHIQWMLFIKRSFQFYAYQFILPMVIFMLVNFMPVFYQVSDLNDRLGISVTILLTIAATNLSMIQNIPKVPYLTKLSISIFLDQIIILALCGCFVVTNYLDSEVIDNFTGLGLFLIWCFKTLYINLSAYFQWKYHELQEADFERRKGPNIPRRELAFIRQKWAL